ncbi:MAG: 4-hydroxy-tetrahydrodipicolinate synthase [Bacteroidales bacterium]|nr:4-hydroxy-tetrahydrodipicolinate synthase [Bacteroidales bacterium]
MNYNFKGTGVAIVTPFHRHGTIDFSSLKKIIEHLIGNGVNYLVVMGTTGESVVLSKDEKYALINFVVEEVDSRVPIVFGIGGNNTQLVKDTILSTDFKGIDAILSVSPYYNKPQQKGIYLHYKEISGASPVPLILYNVPGRTNSNISAETTLELAKHFKNIIGIKEASGNLSQIMQIIKNKPKDFLVISGDDVLTLPIMAIGGDGAISVTANAFPKEYSEMVSLCMRKNKKQALELHYKLLDFTNEIFADGSPSGIKAALDILGLCENNLRLPLVKVNKAIQFRLKELITEIQQEN